MPNRLILTLITLGKYLEAVATGRASRAILGLLDLAPPRARVLRNGGEVEIAASEVRPGDMVVVRPGEKIPVDGIVRDGQSAVDEGRPSSIIFRISLKFAISNVQQRRRVATSYVGDKECRTMDFEWVLFAARWSPRKLALAIWILVAVGAVIGWLYRWIMDDSR